MITPENANLLTQAAQEIKFLRLRNHQMSLRLNMFDDVMKLINIAPPRSEMLCSPDFVSEIESFVEKNTNPDNFAPSK